MWILCPKMTPPNALIKNLSTVLRVPPSLAQGGQPEWGQKAKRDARPIKGTPTNIAPRTVKNQINLR